MCASEKRKVTLYYERYMFSQDRRLSRGGLASLARLQAAM